MNNELKNTLISRYPKIFSKIKEINCDDGWFDLIDIACNLIQGYANRNATDPTSQVAFTNVTEKFGTLRIYYPNAAAHEYVRGIISFSEQMSATVCEVTGERGTLHRLPTGGVKTLSSQTALALNAKAIVRPSTVAEVLASPNASMVSSDK